LERTIEAGRVGGQGRFLLGRNLDVCVWRDSEDAQLGNLIGTQNWGTRLALTRHHLLVSNNVLHDQVFIFLADRQVQLLFVIGDELLDVHVVLSHNLLAAR